MKKLITITTSLAAFVLIGCGGGSSSSSSDSSVPSSSALSSSDSSASSSSAPSGSMMNGRFLDSAVQGLDYNCSSGTAGTTDVNGGFSCRAGDTVTFSVNGYVIGSGIMSEIMTPASLYAPEESSAVLNVTQLLMTLDSDGNPDNGITIDPDSPAAKALAGADVDTHQADFDSAIVSYIGIPLVDEDTAVNHLYGTLEQNGLMSSSSASSEASSASSIPSGGYGSLPSRTSFPDLKTKCSFEMDGTQAMVSWKGDLGFDCDTLNYAFENGRTSMTIVDANQHVTTKTEFEHGPNIESEVWEDISEGRVDLVGSFHGEAVECYSLIDPFEFPVVIPDPLYNTFNPVWDIENWGAGTVTYSTCSGYDYGLTKESGAALSYRQTMQTTLLDSEGKIHYFEETEITLYGK